MNRKYGAAAALLSISAAALLAVPLFAAMHSRAERGEDAPAGFTVISREEYDDITASREEAAMDPSSVLFNGARISYVDAAYTADGCTFYVPQDIDSDMWDGLFSAEDGGELFILEDEGLSDKAASVQEGRVFSCLYVADDETFRRFRLIMTGTATVSVEYDNSSPLTEEGEDHDGLVYVRGTDGTYSTSACTIHIRGGMSRYYDKKSYKLSLKTADGDSNALSLCGLRSDDDWILNSLYMDATRTHEVLAYEVWEEMLTISGSTPQTSRMVYVEVFLNNEYIGLYALMEPVDGKTFQLDDSDLLYKITMHADTDAVASLWPDGIARFNGEEEIDGAKIAWPREESLRKWDVLDTVYRFTQGSLTWPDLTSAGVQLDTQSVTYYELLVVLVCGGDNTWKNSYLVCEADTDGTYTVSPSPWDLNYTWGSSFSVSYNADSADDPDYIHSLLWESWYRDDPDGAWEAACEAWAILRDGGLSAESVTSQSAELWSGLLRTGALFREVERWPGSVDGDSYDEMNEWIAARFETLDAYYGYAAGP